MLAEALRRWYPAEHPVVLYAAGTLPPFEPTIVRAAARGPRRSASVVSTPYVSPLPPGPIDEGRAARLRATVPGAAAE